MKAIVINGCNDCPYNVSMEIENSEARMCIKGSWKFGFDELIPTTPHPDCKLNDLPDDREIELMSCEEATHIDHRYFARKGANFVIERIKK